MEPPWLCRQFLDQAQPVDFLSHRLASQSVRLIVPHPPPPYQQNGAQAADDAMDTRISVLFPEVRTFMQRQGL